MIVCDSNIQQEQLHDIQLARPKKAGRVWQGVQHGELVDALSDEIMSRPGWNITDRKFSLSNDEADLAGAFELEVQGIDAPKDMKLSLGFITSNAMRRSLKLVVGTRVLVCNNGMATGEVLMQRKHTVNFDIYEELEYAVDAYTERAQRIPKLVEGLRSRNLTERESDTILLNAGRAGIMPWSRIGQVDEEYRKPTFADHDERTSFGMLQAFTHIVKKSPELMQMDMMNQFRETLPLDPAVN